MQDSQQNNLAGCKAEPVRKELRAAWPTRKHLAAIFADLFGAQSARTPVLAKIWPKKKAYPSENLRFVKLIIKIDFFRWPRAEGVWKIFEITEALSL